MDKAPAKPVIWATTMLYAQGYKPHGEVLEQMIARAEWMEANGRDFPREITVPVKDPRSNTLIGSLTFEV